ncbi:MAG TPA: hypothetical protein VMW56_09270, partial [Candidatus Margulisiibacteriota bacterium]|nr:hypothetical protein [Candidatus Margulisiibacteriota bacterium]
MLALLVRGGVPLREALIHTNRATYAQYREIGSWLREHYRGQVGYSEIEVAIRLSFLFYRPQAPFPPPSYGVLYATRPDGSPPSLQRWNVESRWRK